MKNCKEGPSCEVATAMVVVLAHIRGGAGALHTAVRQGGS